MLLQTLTLRQWVTHCDRAASEGILAWPQPGVPADDEDHRVFSVTSGSIEGLLYTVLYSADAEGQHAVCDCPAGEAGTLCKHVATVAILIGILDADEVAAEGARIRVERDRERALVQQERKREREAVKAAREAEAIAVGKWIRVQRPHPDAGRLAVIERVYDTGMLRATLEATKAQPAATLTIPRELVKPTRPARRESQLTPEQQAKGMAVLMAPRAS